MKRVVRHAKKLKELRVINNILTLIVLGLGLYIIFAPLLPQADYWVKEKSPLKRWTSEADEIVEAAGGTIGSDRLFIPKLGLSEIIYNGAKEPLSKGVIHRPSTSTPDKGGNTVLVGHRFMYDVRGVFYHLDKLKVGDAISVHWFPGKYDYKVTEIREVTPDQIEIEGPTDTNVLTLYTCTPLWTAKNRLVVRAELQAGQP